MSFEDQFTSIQLDKDEEKRNLGDQPPIEEEDSISTSDILLPQEDHHQHQLEQQEPGQDDDTNFDEQAQVPTSNEPRVLSKVTPVNSHEEPDDEARKEMPKDIGKDAHPEGGDEPQEGSSHADDSGLYGNSVDSPNLASTYQNLYSDHSDFETYKLETTVTSPIRDLDAGSKPFISYLLTTTTNNPKLLKLAQKSLKNNEDYLSIQTRRRYGDFRYLHDSLSKDYPMVMIPPLPSKSNFKYLTGDTFSTDFVHKRLNSLNRFIKFIINHKILSQASIYHLFVSDSPDWLTFTKSLKLKDTDESSGSGFVNKVVNEEITESFMNFLTPSKHKRETNKDILEINDKLKKLYENLMKLDRLFTRLNRKNHDLSVDYDQFSSQILKLAQVQKDEGNENDLNLSSTNDKSEDVMFTNFKLFAESLSYFSKNWQSVNKYIDESFLVSLKDCSRYIISLTNLINLEHNKKIDLQVLQDYLQKSKNELSILGGGNSNHRAPPSPVAYNNGGIVNTTTQLIKDTLSTSATNNIGSSTTDNKIEKLHKKIAELEQEIEVHTKVVNDLTNNIVNEEYPDWDRFNRNELKDSMLGLCDEQIKFYRGLIDNWSEVELKLSKRLEKLG